MSENRKLLIKSIALPLLVGAVAGLLTRNAMQDFDTLIKPPLSPPGWLFPVVWTILYTLMGISAYLIKTSDASAEAKSDALMIYNELSAYRKLPVVDFLLQLRMASVLVFLDTAFVGAHYTHDTAV